MSRPISEQDYFNLMAVYADAVFFPLLTEQTFLQEGHRFEVNDKGKVEIQGVVFNEMKGEYSSLESVVDEEIKKGLFGKSSYRYDSGGDPLEIPDLTYQEFLDFHKKFYIPANCFLFLYGNIPSEKQLDFINEKVLVSFTNSSNIDSATDIDTPTDIDTATDIDTERKKMQDSFDRMTFVCDFDSPKQKMVYAPFQSSADKNGKSKDTAIVAWNLGEVRDSELYMKSVLLSEILMGHDGSPISKALLDCNLGEDLAPNTGLDSDMRYIIFNCGLRGVKKNDVGKVEKVIMEVIDDIVENGIQKSDLESALMSCEIYFKEIVRSFGPYSLVLMRRAYKSWMNGGHPVDGIMTYVAFEKIKTQLEKNPSYLEELVSEMFQKNKNRLLLVVRSDKNYNKRSEKDLARRLKVLKKGFSKSEWTSFIEEIKANQEDLHKLQLRQDTEEEAALLPHIKPQDLKVPDENVEIVREKIDGIDFFSCEQAVNGIVYFQIMFPVDVLEAKYYPYLQYFATCLTNIGFLDKDWAESAGLVSTVSGGLTASIFTSNISPWLLDKIGEENLDSEFVGEKLYQYDPCVGRNLLTIKMKFLEEKTEDALNLFFDFLRTVKFTDEKRIFDLAQEYRNDMVSSVVSCGHDYAMSRSSCKCSKMKALDEIFNGISAVFISDMIAKKSKTDGAALLSQMEEIKTKIFNAGFFFNMVAEKTGIEKAKQMVKKQLEKLKSSGFAVKSIEKPALIPASDFYALTELDGKNVSLGKNAPFGKDADIEVYLAETQVGYCAKTFNCSKVGTKNAVLESMYAHYLSNNLLWDKIRTVCGSYGVFTITSGMEGLCTLLTYRDPNPYKSNELFDEILQLDEHLNLSCEDFERLIAGCFSKELQPKTPASKGFIEFVRFMSGTPKSYRKQKVEWLLNASVEELDEVRKSFMENIKDSKTAIIFSKPNENCRKIIDIRL